MSRNKENVAFSRARPGNTLISNSARRLPSDDFFTDSLAEISKIPTPSPTKPLDSPDPVARSRRTNGTAKPRQALPEAKPTPERSPPAVEAAPGRLQSEKTPSHPSRRHNTAHGRRHKSESIPTTPRRLPSDVTRSPISESSPPKGLTDVYQRIADEEDIAAQEGELGDEEEFTQDSMADAMQANGDRALLGRFRLSRSPSRIPRPRRRDPDPGLEDDNKENERLERETVFSEPSGMSFLRELTDQALAAKLTPHTIDHSKDRARLDKALQKDSPIAFSRAYARGKANPLPNDARKEFPVAFSRASTRRKADLTPENLRKSGAAMVDDRVEADASPTGSVTTEKSEPPPNIPRTWGTKAKVGREWLNRNHRNSTPADYDQSSHNLTADSSQVDWAAAAAEVPLPSVESSTTPRSEPPQGPASASLQKQSSRDRIREWEINDFTGHSLQVSNTPPVRVRTNGLGQLREKEMEDLEKQAATTNRLGQMRQKDSREPLGKISRSPSGEPLTDTAPESDLLQPKIRAAKPEDIGELIPDTPIVIYKAPLNGNGGLNDIQTNQHDQDRRDSHNTLQRLARVMSESPRPSPSPEDWSLVGKTDDATAPNGEGVNANLPQELSRRSPKQVAGVGATPQGVKVAEFAKTPVVVGAWTDTILPDTVKSTTTKTRKELSKYTQTPHVKAGGWIDTPIPTGRQLSSAPDQISIQEVPESLTEGIGKEPSVPPPPLEADTEVKVGVQKGPELPKSALSGILDRAKKKRISQGDYAQLETNDTLNLGDATIESLEDLMSLDPDDMTTLIRMGTDFDARKKLGGGVGSDASAEAELLERLGTKLDRLRTNIHDARKGISKLEHQVSHSEPPAAESTAPTPQLNTASADAKIYLVIRLPRFFRDKRPGQWLPRPTALGWICLIFSTWYLAESAMCRQHCHPTYAEFYDWPDEPEPTWGIALPVMLWRWSRLGSILPVLLGPIWAMLVALFRIMAQAGGWSDGFVDGWPAKAASAAQTAAGKLGEAVDGGAGLGNDLSMMNDEFT